MIRLYLFLIGKESLTEYQVLKRYKIKNQFYNLLKITLHTGRTHQIRVTMSSLAHPVVGMKYSVLRRYHYVIINIL
jgi:23S rRNA pseudouridine1911/1915/1917 synthase